MPSTKARVRRSPEAAKVLFLKCAEELLVSQGLAAVQMRAVARSANVTDAAVAHHFRNRDGLLEALMNQVAAKVRGAIGAAAEAWTGEASTVLQLVSILDDLYSKGYAELAQALYSAGWRETGSPILNPVAETLIATNQKSNHRCRRHKARTRDAPHGSCALTDIWRGVSTKRWIEGATHTSRRAPEMVGAYD